MSRTAGPIEMFRDDTDRSRFCALLEKVLRRLPWTCCAFCLMTTHFHLVLEVGDGTLSDGMQSLNWAYASRFNKRHKRKGHLVGERFTCRRVRSNRRLLRLFAYVAHNPVKAGLCKSPADWYWGSYRGAAGYGDVFGFVDHTRIRAFFGEDNLAGLRAYFEDVTLS